MQSYTFVFIIITLITLTSILAQYSVQKDTQKELAVSFKTKQKVLRDPGIQNPLPIKHHTQPPSKGNTHTHNKQQNHTQNHANLFHHIHSKSEETNTTECTTKSAQQIAKHTPYMEILNNKLILKHTTTNIQVNNINKSNIIS